MKTVDRKEMAIQNINVLERDFRTTESTTLFLLSWLLRMRHSIMPGLYLK